MNKAGLLEDRIVHQLVLFLRPGAFAHVGDVHHWHGSSLLAQVSEDQVMSHLYKQAPDQL